MSDPARSRTLAISMGDPLGIGPACVARALARHDPQTRVILVGDEQTTRAAMTHAGVSASRVALLRVESTHPRPDPGTHAPTAWGGDVSFQSVNLALDLVLRGEAHALVTAPISKAAWALAGHRAFPGHTELLAMRCESPDAAMMFVAEPDDQSATPPGLRVILASVHVPLARVPGMLSTARVLRVIELAAATTASLGVASPRVGVCGLNPHAGEGGLLGSEDQAIIAPAIEAARAKGIDATGPLPADTAFARALILPCAPAERYDVVVAMYHDQGLGPLKTIAWDRAVNLTVGLRSHGRTIIRTSPDHGTAYDLALAGGTPHEGSMLAAMRLALRMSAGEGSCV